MTRTSSRHKSHKHRKHSSRDYSDSDEEDVKMDRSYRSYRDSASGEKRKVKDSSKDLIVNGQVLEEYVSSKRRKEKSDVDDKRNGGVGDVEKEISLRVESKSSVAKVEKLKTESKLRESVVQVESLEIEFKSKNKSKSKRHELGERKEDNLEYVVLEKHKYKSNRYETDERKEDNLESAAMEKNESNITGESKRKTEKDSYSRKERESKEKERRSCREKIAGQESKHGVDEVKFVDADVGKKHVSQSVDINDDKQSKRSRSNNVWATGKNLDLLKESEKRIHKRTEVSSERDKHISDFKETHERRLSSKADPVKESKYKDDKQNDAEWATEKNPELEKESEKRIYKRTEVSSEKVKNISVFNETHERRLSSKADLVKETKYKDDKQNDAEWVTERNLKLEKGSEKRIHKRTEASSEREKHINDCKETPERRLSSKVDPVKETKYKDDKQKDASYSDKHRDDKNREDGGKEVRHRDDKREDSNRELRCRDEKPREDGDRDIRRQDDKYREVMERELRDDNYHAVTDREHRHKYDRYRVDGDKDNRKDERYYDDGESDDRRRYDGLREEDRDNRQKGEKHRDDTEQDTRRKDREKRHRNSKYRDDYEYKSRDRYGENSDPPKGDGYAADHTSRKSNVYDDSSTHEDRTVRFLDDQSRKKTNEKDDYGDVRYESWKDQRFNAEVKSVNGAGMDVVPERGRSTSRNADIELNSNHGRRRNSPDSSPHDMRDQFSGPNQDESKYRDISCEDRVRHSTSSTREYTGTGGSEKTSPRSLDKHGKKGDSKLGELSGERRLKSDILPSSLQLVDKSPLSGADKRQFSRPDMRSAGDLNDNASKEGRASREIPMNVINRDEFSKADADTLSVSSPFARNSHLSNNSKSFPRSPHVRVGMDSPLPLNSVEDESRGKPNNRHRRIFDPKMGRMQGNAWRGMPSWPHPMSNGFFPFSQAPPPLNFMQTFPSPPIFSVRPSMDMNHSLSSPYHSSQVHNMGWRNQCGDSFSTLDANNSGFADESHNYGRSNWDISRNLNGNLWTGQSRSMGLEMPSSDLENNSTRSGDEALGGEATKTQQIQSEEQAESAGICQSSRSIVKTDIDSLVVNQETGDVNSSRKGHLRLSHVYLSRLDISVDLVEPEIFEKCMDLIDVDETMFFDLDDTKFLCMEEAVEAKTATHHEILSYSMFPSADDYIFQKAMSLYKRHSYSFKAEVAEKLEMFNHPITDKEDQSVTDKEDQSVENMEEYEKLTPTEHMQGVKVSIASDDGMEVNPPNDLPVLEVDVEISLQKIDPVADNAIAEKSEEGESVKVSDDFLPVEMHKVPVASGSDNKSGPFLNNDGVSSEVDALVIQESVMSNLSRIHHSPESTH